MSRHARSIYTALLISAAGGAVISVPLILLFPPTDLADAHEAATTPFARAMTAHWIDVVMAVWTCVLLAWMITIGAYWLRWRRAATLRPLLKEATVVMILLMMGMKSVDQLHKLPNAGALTWTAMVMYAGAGLLGLLLLVAGLLGAFGVDNRPTGRASAVGS
ncbi:MAG: hypothetical protein QM783_13580 [Phycisphaerales bacterium]